MRKKNVKKANIKNLSCLLEDYRQQAKVRYPLYEIIMLTIISVMAGMKEYKEFEIFCCSQQKEIERHIPLTNGVPTHHTFRAVLSGVSPEMLEKCYRYWANSQRPDSVEGAYVELDGKTLRGSDSRAKGLDSLHVVSAWLSDKNLSLGHCYGTKKDSEIVQIPKLIHALQLKGAIITIDAIGCQTEITKTIREKAADYIVAVKGNQPDLLEEIDQYFELGDPCGFSDIPASKTRTLDFGHGRIEKREYTLLHDLTQLYRVAAFKDVRAVGRVVSYRTEDNGEPKRHVRYYITSLSGDDAISLFANGVRRHWSIENGCHWSLDFSFREDASRILDRNAAINLACIRKIVLHLLKQDTSINDSLKNKSLRASLDPLLLFRLLFPV